MTYSAKMPREAFVVEIDGHFDSEHGSITAAFNAGLAAMQANRAHAVRVIDAPPQLAAPAPDYHWWMMLDEAPKDAVLEFHFG